MTQPPNPPFAPQPPSGPGGMEPFTPVAPEPFYVPPAPPARKAGGTTGLSLALGLAVLVAACGVSFAAGRLTSPALAASTGQGGGPLAGAPGDPDLGGPTGNGGAAGVPGAGGNLPNPSLGVNGSNGGRGTEGGFGRGGLFGAPSIQGTVQSTDGKTLTVKLANGQVVTVALDGSTIYNQQTSGSQSDVTSGKTVIVRVSGRVGADELQNGGSVGTATTVTVVP
jgi:hypothetical protein